jgi:hypothetical protein
LTARAKAVEMMLNQDSDRPAAAQTEAEGMIVNRVIVAPNGTHSHQQRSKHRLAGK